MITKYSLKKEKCFMIGDKYGDIMAGQMQEYNRCLYAINTQFQSNAKV